MGKLTWLFPSAKMAHHPKLRKEVHVSRLKGGDVIISTDVDKAFRESVMQKAKGT